MMRKGTFTFFCCRCCDSYRLLQLDQYLFDHIFLGSPESIFAFLVKISGEIKKCILLFSVAVVALPIDFCSWTRIYVTTFFSAHWKVKYVHFFVGKISGEIEKRFLLLLAIPVVIVGVCD
jgi:hypothetical protein